MNFIELAQKRQSVRKYSGKAVDREKIIRCVEAARIAPSASNSQPWTFVIVDQQDLKEKVAKSTFNRVISFNKFAIQAPVIVVIVMEKAGIITQLGGRVKKRQFSLIDIGIAAEHFCLQATEEGLGTCMLGWFNEKEIKNVLKVPDNKTIGLIITLGYAETDESKIKKRKDIDVVMKFNKYL